MICGLTSFQFFAVINGNRNKIDGDKIVGNKIQTQTYIEKQVIVQTAGFSDLEQLPPEEGKPPYKGLPVFTEADADWFFGREVETNTLINRLHDEHFLAVVGASGSGKSSLVQAGVIPAMKRDKKFADGTIPPVGQWKVLLITPTARPLLKLATAISPMTEERQISFYQRLSSDFEALNV